MTDFEILSLKYASYEIKNNKVLVVQDLEEDGLQFKYISDDLKNDFGLALIAVKNNGFAIKYLSEDLQNNSNIINMAIKGGLNIEKASNKIKNNKKIIIEVITLFPDQIKYIPEHFYDDRDIAIISLRNNGNNIHYFSKKYKIMII